MSGYAVPQRTPTVIQTARGAVRGWPLGVIVPDLSEGDSSGTRTQNASRLLAAFAEAKMYGLEVRIPPGTFEHDADLVIDWNGFLLSGSGAYVSVLQQVDPDKAGISVGGVTVYGTVIRSLGLTGAASGDGHGVDLGTLSEVKNGFEINNVRVIDFGGHGIYTRYTDYLQLNRVKVERNGGDGLYAGTATNALAALNSAFQTTFQGSTAPEGKSGVRLIDADSATFLGCEFGFAEYGLVVEGGSGTSNANVSVQGSRFEGLTVRHAVIGTTGSIIYAPTHIHLVRNQFLGDNEMSYLVEVNGAQSVEIRFCGAGQIPSGGAFVKALTSTTHSKLAVSGCRVNSGAHMFADSGDATSDSQEITYGLDPSRTNPRPLALSASANFAPALGASKRVMFATVPRDLVIRGITAALTPAIPASGTHYWRVHVTRNLFSGASADIATVDSSTGKFDKAFRTMGMTVTGSMLSGSDALSIYLERVGSPPDLEGVAVSLQYEPT